MADIPFNRSPGRQLIQGIAAEQERLDWMALVKQLSDLENQVNSFQPPPIGTITGITITDHNGTILPGIVVVNFKDATASSGGTGIAEIDVDNKGTVSSLTHYLTIPLAGQTNQTGEEYPRETTVEIDLSTFTDIKCSAKLLDSGLDAGRLIRLVGEYWDGSAWQPLGIDYEVATTGNTDEAPASACDWVAIPTDAKTAPRSLRIKPLLAADDSSLEADDNPDYANLTLIARGSFAALKGDPGDTGDPGPTGATGSPGADGQPRQIQNNGTDLPIQDKVNFRPPLVASDDPVNSVTNIDAPTVNTRELLTAARTYYVDTAGSDSNNGLTSGTAFATIQKAVNTAANLDNQGFDVTISIAAGTYNESVQLKSFLGAGDVIIAGATGIPSDVVINGGGGTPRSSAFVGEGVLGLYWIKDVMLQGSEACIWLLHSTRVRIENIDFNTTSDCHIRVETNATLSLLNSGYTISSGATKHVWGNLHGACEFYLSTITLTGSPSFTYFTLAEMNSLIQFYLITFIDPGATGQQYYCESGGVIATRSGGTAILPGDTPGIADAASGGVFN